jgi:hypothetical protein
MKIEIDTKLDSHDEIRKAIKLLMGIVGHKEVYTNEMPEEKPASQPDLFSSPSPAVGNLMSIFDTADQAEKQAAEAPQPEKTDDVPQVEFY